MWCGNPMFKMHKIPYRILLNAAPVFYFSKWIFGWGSIQNNPQKVGLYSRKTTKTWLFTNTWDSIQEWVCIGVDTVVQESSQNTFWYSKIRLYYYIFSDSHVRRIWDLKIPTNFEKYLKWVDKNSLSQKKPAWNR